MSTANRETTFYINYETLFELDTFFKIPDPDQMDEEIEDIVGSLWDGIGAQEELLKPFFTIFLQSNLLRPLYIYYFSLKAIKQEYGRIVINASHLPLDIVAISLGIDLSSSRSFHDAEFYLVENYFFSRLNNKSPFWKELLRRLYWEYRNLVGKLTGINVLYLIAGKLEDDFKNVEKALSASRVPIRKSDRVQWDLEFITTRVLENINKMKTSIPKQCLKSLIELRVLAYLPELVNRIGTLVEVIESCNIRLVILSAVTHEDHLCLVAAARIAGVDSLVISHGVTFVRNSFIDPLITYQAIINEIEPIYNESIQFRMKSEWFQMKSEWFERQI